MVNIAENSTTHSSVFLTGIGVGDESIPHFPSPLVGHVECSILKQEGHELKMNLHTLHPTHMYIESFS